jgi:septal ring-binding cell division protein DamX
MYDLEWRDGLSLFIVVVMALQGAVSGGEPEEVQFRPPAFTLHGYVLQVGAYRDEVTAKEKAALIGDGRTFVVPIRREGQDWYVVLYDNYANRQSAELAAEQFHRDFPRESFWIRDAAQLRKVLKLGPAKDR